MKALAELKEKFDAVKKQIAEDGKVAFSGAWKEFFAEHEDVKTVSWTQYTPYFNDGDECVFGVNSDYPELNGKDEYDEAQISKKAFQDAAKIIGCLPDETMRDLFGDHVQVTVKRNGEVETEEYSHD